MTTPPEALTRRLLAGQPLVLRDERYCLENGVLRIKRTAAAHKKRQQVAEKRSETRAENGVSVGAS